MKAKRQIKRSKTGSRAKTKPKMTSQMKRIVTSTMIGNGLEWYDYALYGHFAALIGQLFFPSDNAYVSLIATFGVFAAGFMMRPLGALLFGYIGDIYGRKISLAASILLMAIPTAAIGLLPTYAEIGIWAPILLTIIRLLQGLSLGGELSGSMIFVVEHAPQNRRGLAGSVSFFSMCLGILLGSAAGAGFAEFLPKEDFETWGWRIPFLFGIVIGLVGFYIRQYLAESPHYLEAKEKGELANVPVRRVFRDYWKQMLLGVGIYLTVTVPFYALVIFMNSMLTTMLQHPIEFALTLTTLSVIVLAIFIPITAHLSDKIGRKPILVVTAIAILVFAYPCFWLLTQEGMWLPAAGQLIFAVLVGIFLGPVPTILVELFPTSVRYTGMSLAYNFSAAAFGGTTPIIATWLIKTTDSYTSVAFYIMICAVLSLVSLYYFKDRWKERLR